MTPDDNQSAPAITTLCFVLIGVFLLFNLCVVASCFDTPQGCGALNALIPNLDIIPLIRRPVAFLQSQGNAARAELVRDVYSFTWSAALAQSALLLSIVGVWLTRLTPADKTKLVASYERLGRYQDASMAQKGVLLFRLLFLGALCWLVWGVFDFEGHGRRNPLTNAVHVRNRDLFTPAVVWAFAMMFGFALLFMAIRDYLIRQASTKPCG